MLAARRRRASANSGFQQITRQAAPKRQEWRRFDLRSALVTTALGTGVLVGANLMPASQALACVDVTDDPNSVSCDGIQTTTDNTLDVTAAGADSNDNDERHYLFSDHGPVAVDIAAGSVIDGNGLAVTTTQAGSAIIVDHQGAISANNPTAGGTGVFDITTNGGDVTYTGNGSVIDNGGGNNGLVIDTGAGAGNIMIGSAGTPATPAYQGFVALRTNSGTGNQNIFLDGGTLVSTGALGDGMFASSSTGDINIDLTGNTQITTTVASPNIVWGVRAESSGGAITISTDADMGSPSFELHRGVSSFSTGGPIDITQTGGTIMATDAGIFASSSGATGDISITTDAGGLIDMTGGTGIVASQLSAAGGVTVTVNGTITGADTGVSARIFNPLNSANVDVSASGGIQALTGSSISAITDGTGNATVNLLDGADLQGGVLAQSTTGNAGIVAGNNVTVVGNSPGAASITAGGNATQVWGDNAAVSGSSGLVVDQTNPAGAGVATVLVGADGTIVGDGTDATDDYDGNGIFAGNQGTGETSVTTGAGTSVTGEANGIFASQTNAANTNDISITTDGPVTGNGGIPFTLSPYTDAFVGAGLPTTGLGIGVSNEGTGDIIVTAGDTVTGANVGIQILAAGGGGIAVVTNGAVEGTANTGILAETADGDIAITANGDVTGGDEGILATAGGTGNIAVTTGGAVEGTVDTGILTVTNDGDIAIAANGDVTGGNDGILASAGGTGNIAVTTGGAVEGTAATGIQTVTNDGDIAVTANGDVTGGNDGILAAAGGTGTIVVTTGGSIAGTADDGIATSAVNGDTTVQANADVTGGDDGIDATATGAGNIAVIVGGGGPVTGTSGSGVTTTTATGNATIDNAGLIQGAFAAISGATSTVLDVVNQAGGLIRNLSADISDLAISVTGTGVTDIDNDGTIRGRVELGSGNDSFDNSGLWATSGTSDFGAGNDTVANTGRVDAADLAAMAEIAHLANLESFTNASTGVIDMVDDNAPNVGDELTIDGLYTGVPGSIVQMDLALVSGDPQAGSDLLILDAANPAMGTSDFLFNIVSTGVTATTADANRVAFAGGQILAAPVTVVENRGTLITSSGDDNIPLARSGLITYDLVSTAAAGGDYQVVSQFDAGLAGGLLLPIPATLATVAFTTQRTPNPITATCIDPDNKPNAQGGWARGLAGQFHTESAGKASIGGVTSDLESDNHTRFKTLQGGFDHVLCNIDSYGSTLHLGVTVGQTWGDSVQQDPDPAAGIFGTDVEFDTFFVGPYAAFTRGDFAAQASLRYDYHSLEISNQTVGVDAAGLDVDAEGISGSASMSYDFPLATLTVTPDVGVNVSNTDIDSFDIAGGTVALDDLWSVMGHAGVTARTEPLGVADNLFVVPFASATLYHEFIEHADGEFDIGGTVIESESNRIGTFGQLGIGANAVRLGDVVAGRPTLFGGARFDLQVGERIEGATATVFGRVQF